MHEGAERIIHSNVSVSRRIEQLSKDIKRQGPFIPDESVGRLFDQANLDILETIKKDSALVGRFQNAELAASEVIERDDRDSSSMTMEVDSVDSKKAPSSSHSSKKKCKKDM